MQGLRIEGLLRQTILPQGATNSVAQFVCIATKILEELIPHVCCPFVDDIGVKVPRTNYGGEEAAPGIRRFILEHIINLDKVMVNLERAGCTISGEKSQFCMPGIKIVGYACDSEGRHPESAKVVM
jgi:Reverse transcriptase (RNA-dependent DNA polymerase)